MRASWWSALIGIGCGGGSAGKAPIEGDGEPPACGEGETYPDGAAEPMALGEVLAPYRWPVAIDRSTGARTALDLADVPCDLDAELGWGRFDALLFVSIPAW